MKLCGSIRRALAQQKFDQCAYAESQEKKQRGVSNDFPLNQKISHGFSLPSLVNQLFKTVEKYRSVSPNPRIGRVVRHGARPILVRSELHVNVGSASLPKRSGLHAKNHIGFAVKQQMVRLLIRHFLSGRKNNAAALFEDPSLGLRYSDRGNKHNHRDQQNFSHVPLLGDRSAYCGWGNPIPSMTLC
jgi:hypothetical protein